MLSYIVIRGQKTLCSIICIGKRIAPLNFPITYRARETPLRKFFFTGTTGRRITIILF